MKIFIFRFTEVRCTITNTFLQLLSLKLWANTIEAILLRSFRKIKLTDSDSRSIPILYVDIIKRYHEGFIYIYATTINVRVFKY